MLVSLDGDANSLVDAVLGVNVDVAGAFLFRFDASVFRHSCDLRVCGRKFDVHMLFDRLVFRNLLSLYDK